VVNVGPGPVDIATLPTSSLSVGICVLRLRVLARDACGHDLTGSVKVVLHAVELRPPYLRQLYSCRGARFPPVAIPNNLHVCLSPVLGIVP
jgi:hypothetical protein